MFRLPNAPPPQAETHEIADFVEWCAWRYGKCSARAANKAIDQVDDNFENDGCDDNSDETSKNLEEVFIELERRVNACGGGYPFRLDNAGSVLTHLGMDADPRHAIYHYLLLSTRLDMKNNREHAKIDGADLLEHLGAHVMRNYLGINRAKSEVFGTSRDGGFSEKVDALCRSIGEGGGFSHNDTGRVYAKDAKLDVVSWIPFSDGHPGKLIVFTQCKTGSTWRDRLGDLNPEAFLKTWTQHRCTALNPIRAFCVSEATNQSRWTEISTQAGIFLDRCRIVDFAHDIDPRLLKILRRWTKKAFDSLR
ncbi:MAG: hypothetical protein ACOYM3_28565 [Terrimicrobiaceae bacterium]